MKNKTVKMLIALVTLGVVCGAYAGVKNYTAKQEEQEETEQEEVAPVTEIDAETLNSIKFLVGGKEESFTKEEDVWKKTDDKDFPVNQTTLEDAAESLSGIAAERVLEDVDDLSEYGLDDPDNTITIGQEDETKTIIHVGMLNESTSQYYINKDYDENTVYVVDSGEIESFMNVQSVYDYAEKEEFPEVEAASITEIKVEKEEDSYTMEKNPDTDFWYISGNIGDTKYESEKADTAQASTLTSSINGLEFSDLIDYNCEDDAQYGFDAPYAVVTVNYEEEAETEETVESSDSEGVSEPEEADSEDVVVSDEENEPEEVAVSDEENESEEVVEPEETDDDSDEAVESEVTDTLDSEDSGEVDDSEEADSDVGEDETEEPEMVQKQLVIYVGEQADGSARYVKINDNNQVYTISNDNLDAVIEKTVSDYWDLTVNYVSLNDLESLDIDAEAGKHTVNVSRETSEDEDGETTEVVSYLLDSKEIENTSFTTFYNKLNNMAGQSRLIEAYEPEDSSVMKIVSHKTSGETIETNFYEYDSNFYAVIVEDKTYLVNKMTVKELLSAYDEMTASAEENTKESGDTNDTDADAEENTDTDTAVIAEDTEDTAVKEDISDEESSIKEAE